VDAEDSFSRELQDRIATFDQRFHDKFGDLEAKDAPPGAATLCSIPPRTARHCTLCHATCRMWIYDEASGLCISTKEWPGLDVLRGVGSKHLIPWIGATKVRSAWPMLYCVGTNEVAKRTLSNMLGGLGYSAGHPIIGLPDKSAPSGECAGSVNSDSAMLLFTPNSRRLRSGGPCQPLRPCTCTPPYTVDQGI
jgi:hypothetical protein